MAGCSVHPAVRHRLPVGERCAYFLSRSCRGLNHYARLAILGLFRRAPLATLAQPLSRVAAIGAVLAIVTGFLLFSTRPTAYVQNPAFLAKTSLVAIGILNAVGLHRTRSWGQALHNDEIGSLVRISAVVSLAVRVAAVVAGRWIGFLQ